ncbi:MAG: recombinase family protein [Clostridiaceae bacterium]
MKILVQDYITIAKKWNKLMEECTLGVVKTVLIAHKDRFVRFGYDWFERFLKSHGVEIMIVNHEKRSPQEELVHDLHSKEIGGIVGKYSVAIKKKTEYMFYPVVCYLQEVSR